MTERLYHNPIIRGTHPDPSICRVGEDYYICTSTFACFPAAPIFHSRDLVHWRQIGHALTRREQLPLDGVAIPRGMYAPSLRHINGRFYMITTLMGHPQLGCRHLYVSTEDPAGEWSDAVWIDQPGIDPDLFQDDDGRTYFLRNTSDEPGPRRLVMGEIDLKTGTVLGEMKELWKGTGGYEPEGPHLYHIGDWYYLLAAEGGTGYGHMVTIARSRSLWGPFESSPLNPILSHRDVRPHPIQCLGHADLFQDHTGNWWMVFLGVRPPNGWSALQHLGRETFLAPVTWENGWPVVNGGRPVELLMEAPLLPPAECPMPPVREDFDSPTLGLDWMTLRQPPQGTWSLDERPGWLRLHGNASCLNDEGTTPALVGRWQTEMTCKASAKLDFEPAREGDEAGLATYMRESHHYEVAVGMRRGVRVVFLRRRIHDLQAVVAEEELPPGPVELVCTATPETYTFGYRSGSAPLRILGTASIAPISSDAACTFTGMMLALYATGNGRTCQAPADFDWFEYLPCNS